MERERERERGRAYWSYIIHPRTCPLAVLTLLKRGTVHQSGLETGEEAANSKGTTKLACFTLFLSSSSLFPSITSPHLPGCVGQGVVGPGLGGRLATLVDGVGTSPAMPQTCGW